MMDQTWLKVDQFFEESFVQEPEFVSAARDAANAAKLPEISVSAAQGKFLAFLVQISGAKRILELGTLGGYSTLWMAQALPQDGRIITLDNNPVCAGVARANFSHAGMDDKIELRYGEAIDRLKQLVGEKLDPFDLIFIDANKSDYPMYLQWALRLSQKGSIIVADNIVRGGEIVNAETQDKAAEGLRQFHQDVSNHKKLDATAIQTVGSKGYDGLAFIRVIA